jgi:lipid-A-disaccharide synthase
VAEGDKPLDVFLVAGEASGDALGGALMAALRTQLGGHVRFKASAVPR